MMHPTVQLRLQERSMRDEYSLLKKKDLQLEKKLEEMKAREEKLREREEALKERESKAMESKVRLSHSSGIRQSVE